MQSVIFRNKIDAANELTKRLYWLKDEIEENKFAAAVVVVAVPRGGVVIGGEKITEPGQTGTNPEEAAEIAGKKGMAKGTAGAAETGGEYEQGAAGANK